MIFRPGTPGASGGINYKKQLDVVMANLNKEIGKIKDASEKGMINAAIFIRNQTESTPPVTPVDLGNLRSSWFITTASKKVANDQWNKGFRKSNASGKKISNKDMASAHTAAISDAKGEIQRMNSNNKKFLMMGYSANYAGYVHEFVSPNINWKREGANAKWLQSHIYTNSQKIFQIIAETSKIR